MGIHPVGAELLHADGETHRHDEANSRFSHLCERSQWNLPANRKIRIKKRETPP